MNSDTQLKILNLFDSKDDCSFVDEKNIEQVTIAWIGAFKCMYIQAYNGGLKQYFTNNYHSSFNTSIFNVSDDPDLLVEFIKYSKIISKELNLNYFPEFISFLQSIENVEIDNDEYEEEDCSECFGNGEIENSDYNSEEDSEEYITCSCCNGDGKEEIPNENYGDITPSFENKIQENSNVFFQLKPKLLETIVNYICKNDLHEDIGTVYIEHKIQKNLNYF
jgi:hypothetical protein